MRNLKQGPFCFACKQKRRAMLGLPIDWCCVAAVCQVSVQHYYPLAEYTSMGFRCITLVHSIRHAEPLSNKVSD